MFRIWSLAVLVVGIWLLSVYGPARPDAQGLDAPATEFSAARASAALGRILGPERPHPTGSAENAAVRARLMQALTAMGVQAHAETLPSCWSEKRWGNIPCGTITNVIAPVTPGSGKAVLLMAHYDSVAAGPGACDDGCGLATLLEAIRVLKMEAAGRYPVVAVFTDGEEPGLLGAAAYFRDPVHRVGTGMVINVDNRGNRGASMLFQTSPGDSKLIDLYARAVPHVATSSLYAEIYKRLPNDTDMTTALAAGLPGYNFAMIGDVAQYHTPLDRRDHIDLSSLQQQGEAALALVRKLRDTDPQALKGGNAIYLDVLGRWLPRLPLSWALPLSILCFVLIALAGFATRRERRELPRPISAFLMPPLLVLGCIGLGFVLHGLAGWISGSSDPSFAHPVWLRLSLGFGAFAVALLTSRWSGGICGWLWFAGLGIGCAIWAPGITPFFLFPSLVAAPLLLATVRGGRDVVFFIAALAALVIWVGLTAQGEDIMGLKLHALFTASAAFGLMTLLPLLKKAENWASSFGAASLIAVVLAVAAGLQPAFSDAAPQRLNIRYVEQGGEAWWMTDPVAHLPQNLREAAAFSAEPQRHALRGYAAPAGKARLPALAVGVTRSGSAVTFAPQVPGEAVALLVPRGARMQSVTFGDVTVAAPPSDVTVMCVTPHCGSSHITLSLASTDAQSVTLIARGNGLPPDGAKLVQARPGDATPSQEGDVMLRAATIAVPAR